MERQRFGRSDAPIGPVSDLPRDILLKPPLGDATLWWRGLAVAADGAFAITGDRRVVLWNRAAARITGYEAAEALGRCCCNVLLGRDGKRDRLCSASCRLLGQIKDGESVETFDLQATAKSGRSIWLNVSTIVLGASDANAPRWIHLFRDITAVKGVLALIRHRLASPAATDDPANRLTRREVEVLRLMSSGATNRAMAERLHVSPATIRNHTHKIFGKLGVANRLAAVTYAMSQLLL